MLFFASALLLSGLPSLVSALGTQCTAPLGAGLAAPSDPFWMETIKHQGISAFNPNSSTYEVFRNVKVRKAHENDRELAEIIIAGFWCNW